MFYDTLSLLRIRDKVNIVCKEEGMIKLILEITETRSIFAKCRLLITTYTCYVMIRREKKD